MKRSEPRVVVLLSLAAVFSCASCLAPVGAAYGQSSRMTREELLAHRQQLVRQSLGLDAQQKIAFDPIYTAYEAERTALAQEREGLVTDYARAALAATPEQAKDLTERFLRLRRRRLDLDEKYRDSFAAVLPPQKVLLFLQLNFVMDAVVNYDLAGAVPLVK